MTDEFRALDAHNKRQKDIRHNKVLAYLTDLEMQDLIELQPLNISGGHYRVHLPNARIDVWATTCKFTLLGSNKYDNNLVNLKKLIKEHL